MAVKAAQEKASLLAKELGRSIGKAHTIKEKKQRRIRGIIEQVFRLFSVVFHLGAEIVSSLGRFQLMLMLQLVLGYNRTFSRDDYAIIPQFCI